MSKNSKNGYSLKEERQGKRVIGIIALAFILLGAFVVIASFLF